MALQPLTRIQLGIIGEDLPSSEFSDIINLNTLCHNFPVFDHLAKKDNEVYVFSTKMRKRLGANGKINPSYNIIYNSKSVQRKFNKAIALLKEHGYNVETIHYCFLVAPLSESEDCKYYWGELKEINPKCTYQNMCEGKIQCLAVPVKDSDLQKYKVFGIQPWSYIQENYIKR